MQVNLTPEIVRIAQTRANAQGIDLASELARVAIEEIIFNMNPELNFIVHQSDSLNSIDCIASSLHANDVVINRSRFDVRALDDKGQITVPRILVNSQATINGSFVVKIENNEKATIISYISAGKLVSSVNYSGDQTCIVEDIDTSSSIDIVGIIQKAEQRIQAPLEKVVSVPPTQKELHEFLRAPARVEYTKQRDILATLCQNESARDSLRNLPSTPDGLDNGVVTKMLRSGSRWNRNTEEMAIDLSSKFNSLSKSEIKTTLTDIGETYGGQPEAPKFKKAALKKLTIEHMAKSLGKEKLAKVKSIMDKVVNGSSVVDAIKDKVKNNVAVDLAITIKKNRKNVGDFVSASAEEIGMAFQQLAIQPAYATHSSSDDGVESINEALELLETCEFLEELEV